MDAAYYGDISGILHGLAIRLSDRISADELAMVTEFVDANELGLALESLADFLAEDDRPVTADERADMLALGDRMEMDGRVSRALAFCPER